MINIMFGPFEEDVGQPPTGQAPGDVAGRSRPLGTSRRQRLVAAIASQGLAVVVTILGAVAAMALLVFYAVVIQGWGTPLP
jgi:hypothetical protein